MITVATRKTRGVRGLGNITPQQIQSALRSGLSTQVAVRQAQSQTQSPEVYTTYGAPGVDMLPSVIAAASGIALGAALMVVVLRKRSRA